MTKKEKEKLVQAINNYYGSKTISADELFPEPHEDNLMWAISKGETYREISKQDWDMLEPFFKASVKRSYKLNDDVELSIEGTNFSGIITSGDTVYVSSLGTRRDIERDLALHDMIDMVVNRPGREVASKWIYKQEDTDE